MVNENTEIDHRLGHGEGSLPIERNLLLRYRLEIGDSSIFISPGFLASMLQCLKAAPPGHLGRWTFRRCHPTIFEQVIYHLQAHVNSI